MIGPDESFMHIRWDGLHCGMADSESRHSVFAHLNAEHTSAYRDILTAFTRFRAQFVIQLRPQEVLQELRRGGAWTGEEAEFAAKLQQLTAWGNLTAVRDTAEVSTVEEFYRVRYLYQLSAAGEAAEKALEVFEELLHRPGELQSAALRDIIEFLDAIEALAAAPERDAAKLFHQFEQLFGRFDTLTSRAQTFMRNLQSTIELHGVSVEQFLGYKEMLIEYLERFLSDLVLATNEISGKILALGTSGDLLRLVARYGLSDRLERSPEIDAAEEARWSGRWDGFRRWFVGSAGERPQAEILRARAREAVPELLYTLQTINDRRVSLSNRFADWRTLALWFAEAPDDDSAHRLWRSAFALTPARHLQINEETLLRRDQSGESGRTSWLEAEPVWVSPRLRQSGRIAARGGPVRIIDRSEEKRLLARLARDEQAQWERARALLATGDRVRLSRFTELDAVAFELFLDLLGEALAALTPALEPVEVASTDGSLVIRLELAGDGTEAVITTSRGTLRGPDGWITVRPAA